MGIIRTARRHRPTLLLAIILVFALYLIFSRPDLSDLSSTLNDFGFARSLHQDIRVKLNESSGIRWSGEPRIRQATMLFDGDNDHMRSMYERALDTHLSHGKRWNVPTHVLTKMIVPGNVYFNKPAYLQQLITEELDKPDDDRAEWIVWFDGDSVIMNPQIPWSIFLPPADFKSTYILATRDNNGLNAGMLFIRVHKWSAEVMAEVVALPKLKPDLALPFYDQSALLWVFSRIGYAEHVFYQPRHWWNRYHHDALGSDPGGLIIHFAGIGAMAGGPNLKRNIMAEWLKRLKDKSHDKIRDESILAYQSEVNAYWKTLRWSRTLLERSEKWRKAQEGERVAHQNLPLVVKAMAHLSDTVLFSSDVIANVSIANDRLIAALPIKVE